MSKRGGKTQTAPPSGDGGGQQHIENMAWSLTPPWITLVLLGVLGGVLHVVLTQDTLRLAWGTFGLTIGTVVLAAVASVAGRARGKVTRVHAVTSVIVAGLWLIVCSIVGLGVVGLDLAALGVGAVLALSWNIRRVLRGQGDDAGHTGSQDWEGLADDVKTLRGTIRAKRIEGATAKVELKLPPGVTAQEAQADVPRIAQLMEIPPTGARMTPDPDNAAMVTLSITPEDMLKHTMPWQGPSAAGQSIAERVRLGRYEDGLPLSLVLPGIPRKQSMSHIMLVGMTGVGKSELIQILVGDAGTRKDVEIDYLDVAGKAEQTVGPLKSALRKLITNKKEAAKHLKLLLAEVPERAKALAGVGMREWQPGAPIPFRIIIIDEGASLISENDDFTEMARVLRSVGDVLVLAIQRATYDQMPTSARANFGTVACFGVRSERDAAAALSPETLEAGAIPHVWRNRKPGYLYLEAPGIETDRHSMPARAELAKPEDIERILIQAASLRWQATRSSPDGRAAAQAAVEATGQALADAGEKATIVEDDQDKDTEQTTPSYQPPAHLAEQMRGIDPDADLPDIPGADMNQRIGPPERVPPLTQEQAREALIKFLRDFREASPGQFQRHHLIADGVLLTCGRKRSWLSTQLHDLVDEGVLEQVGEACDGVYAWAHAHAGT